MHTGWLTIACPCICTPKLNSDVILNVVFTMARPPGHKIVVYRNGTSTAKVFSVVLRTVCVLQKVIMMRTTSSLFDRYSYQLNHKYCYMLLAYLLEIAHTLQSVSFIKLPLLLNGYKQISLFSR